MTETQEQIAVVEYMQTMGLMFTATAQSTYTPYQSQKNKNYALGVRRGLPDLVIVVPQHKSIDGKAHLLFIEMKKARGKRGGANGSVVSDEQAQWIFGLREANQNAYICHGAEEAISVINKFVKQQSTVF